MLHILLLILKIMGILFLILVGAVLALLLLVLFVPVRYRGDLGFSGKLDGNVFLSWLFHFFTIQVDFKDETEVTVKVLWFRLFKKAEVSEEDASDLDMPESDMPETAETRETSVKTCKEQEHKMRDQKPEVQALENKKRKIEKTKPKFTERIRLFFKKQIGKIKKRFQWLQDKKKAYDKLVTFIENEENQNTFRLFFRQLKRMIRQILPRRMEGNLRFGTEDPYLTGKILTFISPFYGFYGDKIAVEPVFDENLLEGDVRIKGHIRLAVLIWGTACLFLNRNFRKLYQKLRGKNA